LNHNSFKSFRPSSFDLTGWLQYCALVLQCKMAQTHCFSDLTIHCYSNLTPTHFEGGGEGRERCRSEEKGKESKGNAAAEAAAGGPNAAGRDGKNNQHGYPTFTRTLPTLPRQSVHSIVAASSSTGRGPGGCHSSKGFTNA
jgi:hypothetical protein